MMRSVLAWGLIILLPAGTWAGPPSFDSLHQIHRQRAAQLRGVQIVQTVEATYPDDPAGIERTAQRIRKRADLPLALLLEDLDAVGATPGEVDLAVQGLLDQFGDLDQKAADVARILRINRQRRVRQRLWIDFAGRRVRSERQDLRDLDMLLRTHGLAASDVNRANLDVSDTNIVAPGYRIWISKDQRRATFLPAGRTAFHDWLERLGIVPEAYFTARYPHELQVQSDGGVRVVLRYPDTGQTAGELHLRGAPGYEATYFARYNRDGVRLYELRLSDFRPIKAGFRVPFRAERYRLSRGANGGIRETLVAQTIRWNPPIADAVFVVPRSASMRVVDGDSYDAYRRVASAADGRTP